MKGLVKDEAVARAIRAVSELASAERESSRASERLELARKMHSESVVADKLKVSAEKPSRIVMYDGTLYEIRYDVKYKSSAVIVELRPDQVER